MNKHTTACLTDMKEYAADCLLQDEFPDEPEMAEGWREEVKDYGEALETGRLTERVCFDLMTYLDRKDAPRAVARAVTEDLCRAGFYEKWDERSVYSRRPKTMTVDGVKYVLE